jgi:hypothetical protein
VRWLKRIFGLKKPQKGEAVLRATVIRADGTIEELGVIARGEIDLNADTVQHIGRAE